MARAFSRFALTLTLLVVLPAAALAAPLALQGSWLNSSLTFGGPSFQDHGYDVNGLLLYGDEIGPCPCPEDVFFDAGGGSLVSVTNPAGETVWRYEGGTFSLRFENSVDPFFSAPIGSLEITAFGPLVVGVTNIHVSYQLGAGLFDAGFAALHGVPQQTEAGSLFEQVILFDETPDEFITDEGGGILDVDAPPSVPEPSLSLLLGLGLAAAVRARRRV